MQNEAIPVGVPTTLYFDLCTQLHKSGDMRPPEHIVTIALRSWLADHLGKPGGRGYQWKELFLPEGTNLRLRYQRTWYYATIENDQLRYDGIALSPRDWTQTVTGSVRNPWRDIWVRRSVSESWTQAVKLRAQNAGLAAAPGTNRRLNSRRQTD